MSDFWTGILGGLVGSILTVVITKLLEIFQSSKQHQFSLEKTFFEKKLAAAELAMTQYMMLSNALNNLSILYGRLNKEKNELEEHIQNNLIQQANQQLEVVNHSSFVLANSINLYFDFENQFNQNNIIRNFYDSLASLPILNNTVNTNFEHYLEMKGTSLEQPAFELYERSEQILEDTLQEISVSYTDFNKVIQHLMKQIRNEMKRFEY